MKNPYRIIFYITLMITFYMSIVPASTIPNIAALSFIGDKAVHLSIFFLISLIGLNCKYNISNLFLLSLIFSFGLTIETIHYYHPYRYFEFADLMANLSGIFLALLIYKKKIA